MAFQIRTSTVTAIIILSAGGLSCSNPIFNRASSNPTAAVVDKNFKPKPAKLSGVLDLSSGCGPGFYEIKLKSLFDGANSQVESQSDQSGHFSLLAPAGQYVLFVKKDGCGAKQDISLEENTEHMISLTVTGINAVEKVGENLGRLPASVLIQAHR